MRSVAGALLAAAVLATAQARAAELLGASYDAADDVVVVEIAYRGTEPRHDYYVEWGPCRTSGEADEVPGVAGRVIDRQGREAAHEAFRTVDRLSLEDLPCRPALVTLRLGRFSHVTVFVPERTTNAWR